jgi:outer membrane protein
MNRSFLLIASLASGLALPAAAQTASAPRPAASAAPTASAPVTAQPAKIAVIAFQVAVAQTNEGQREFADLEKKFEPRRDKLKQESDDIDTLTKQLQTQQTTLSDTEQQSRARVIDEKKRQLDRDQQDAQSDFQQSMQDLYNSLASKVYDVMEGYATSKGFTLVLDISQQQSPVLYASEGTNITKEVIEAYNVKSGVPAPPAQSNVPEAPTPRPAQPSGTGTH